MELEEWIEIEMFDRGYLISSFGRFRLNWSTTKTGKKRFSNNEPIKQFLNDRNYLCIRIKTDKKKYGCNYKTRTIHRMVCGVFHQNPENKPQVNHKDGNQQNNHKDNLEWATPKENTQHAWDMGLCKRKWEITESEKDFIRENVNKITILEISDKIKKPTSAISLFIKKDKLNEKRLVRYKKVIDISTGVVYFSTKELCEKLNLNFSTIRKKLNGERPNNTTFRYVKNDGTIIEPKPFVAKERKKLIKKKVPIAIFDLNWLKLGVFEDISDAAVFVNSDRRRISDFLKGKCGFVKGYKFKLLDENGDFIEPKIFQPKIRVKKVIEKKPVTPSQKVSRFDINGNFIDSYSSVGEAARSFGYDKKAFRKSVKKSPKGYYRGFIWKDE